MSTLKVLKEYLVGDDGYLLNDDNNGKTVMLSGAWGSGKTHFWKEVIKPELDKKNQKNIYISLYGRESIAELKFEVLKEAYNLEVKDDIISKSASMLSTIAPSLGEKSLVDGFDKLNKKAKEKKAEEILKSGSIICLDDFERKSTKIDLNDLFGYISQLALDYKCKVVIILNSDIFEGEEANVFKTVKEKTVNKFFYFEPTIEELFDSIYESDAKYNRLDEYRDEILKAIKETEELNARIYIQVLDNCLEWIKNNKKAYMTYMTISTVFFAKHHKTLAYHQDKEGKKSYLFIGDFINYYEIGNYMMNDFPMLELGKSGKYELGHLMRRKINFHKENNKEQKISEDYFVSMNKKFDENINLIIDFYYFIYGLKIDNNIDEEMSKEISNFIKMGILLPDKETKV